MISMLQKNRIDVTLTLKIVLKQNNDFNDLNVENVIANLVMEPESFKIDILLNCRRELSADEACITCLLCQKNTEKDGQLTF